MLESTPDIFESTEPPVAVNAEIVALIEQGIRDADAGRVVPSQEVYKLIPQWFSRFSTQSPR